MNRWEGSRIALQSTAAPPSLYCGHVTYRIPYYYKGPTHTPTIPPKQIIPYYSPSLSIMKGAGGFSIGLQGVGDPAPFYRLAPAYSMGSISTRLTRKP